MERPTDDVGSQRTQRRIGHEGSIKDDPPSQQHLSGSRPLATQPQPERLESDDRLPPPQLFISKTVRQGNKSGASDPRSFNTGAEPAETTSLVNNNVSSPEALHQGLYASNGKDNRYSRGTTPKYKPSPKRTYVGYDGEDEDEYGSRGGHVRVTSLVAFWASFVAMSCSLPMVIYAVYFMVSAHVNAADILTYTMAIVLGTISLCVETITACAPCFPQCGIWKLGRHTMLHCVIAILSVIPFAQGKGVIALLSLLHIVPAGLFYSARIRGEHRAKPQLFSSTYP